MRIVAPKKGPVPWGNMIRSGLASPVMVALGLLVNQPGLGVFAGMGALVGAFGDAGGSFRARSRRLITGAAFGLLGLVLGRTVADQGVVAVLTFAALAAAAALLSSISSNLSFAGLQMLVFAAIAGGLPSAVPVLDIALAFLIGFTWTLVLSFTQSRLQPRGDPALAGEVSVLHAVADELRSPGKAVDGAPAAARDRRAALIRQLSTAFDAVVTARSTSAGRRDDLQRLASTQTATFDLVTVVFALRGRADADPAPHPHLADLVDRLAVLVGQRRSSETRSRLDALAADVARSRSENLDAGPLLDSLTHVLRAAQGRGSFSSGDDHRSLVSYLPGKKAGLFAVRLAVTMAVAEIVRQHVPIEKPYWILLTVALVLQPDLGSVFARGVQRVFGTIAGVLVGAAIIAVVPYGPWLLLPLAVLAFSFPLGHSINYGLLSTIITPLILLLLEFGARVTSQEALGRLYDTAIGAGIVIVVGYLCWPGTWRPQLGQHIAAGVETLSGYARVAFGADPTQIGRARRQTYRAMSDIRSELQSTLSEPPPLSSQAAAWWPLTTELEKAADDLTDAAAQARHPGEQPGAPDVDQLVAGFDDLAAALRANRAPGDFVSPTSPRLADVASDLRSACAIARGPIGA